LSMNYNLTSAPKLYMVAYLLDITANWNSNVIITKKFAHDQAISISDITMCW
jgi:hypothetical protein